MSKRQSVIGSIVTVGAGVAVVAVLGAILHTRGPNSSALAATVEGQAQGALTRASIKLATYPDSMAGEHGKDGGAHPSWVSYGPSTNLHVPAHALVTVTIEQYDSGGKITNPYFAMVHGTVGGTMTVDGKRESRIDPEAVGHTFTIHAAPTNQDPLFVSVPLPALPDDAQPAPNSDYPKPVTVTFTFVTHGKGEYVWNCEYPCGDGYYASFGGPMSTRGYMSGTLTVG